MLQKFNNKHIKANSYHSNQKIHFINYNNDNIKF